MLETHRPQERNKVQAFNDFLVFGLMAIGSFSSGQVLANYGWSTVKTVVFPPVLIGFVALVMAGVRAVGNELWRQESLIRQHRKKQRTPLRWAASSIPTRAAVYLR